MKILVTGFDPFGGDKINPAIEAVKRLPDEINGAEIINWKFQLSLINQLKLSKKQLKKKILIMF